MNKNELRKIFLEKVALKQEGANWDFKRQWYEKEDKTDEILY